VGQRGAAVGRVTGQVAFVSGGSRGIGRAAALALARAGHVVAVVASQDIDGAGETCTAVKELGGDAQAWLVDVRDPDAVGTAFTEVEAAFGPVTIVVNNAGVTRDGLLLRMGDDQWADVLDTNLTGAFNVIRRAAPGMIKARHGRIVNVGSVAGLAGSAGQVNYAAAKAGLVGLTRSVARELASRNITCNVVAPGPITTAMTDALPDDRKAELQRAVPAGRFGTPDEVAAVIAFLCTDAAAYITGAVVPVDGGLGLGH
jgi:3-oxoacyl-[acyl-carrier protein] reductase